MPNKTFVALDKNPRIRIAVTKGHFTSKRIHFNRYLDIGELKFNSRIAFDVAREIAVPYINTTYVDAIVCMDRMEIVGAFLAQELTGTGMNVMNSEREIQILTPIMTTDNKWIFPDNRRDLISNKKILILLGSATDVRALAALCECVKYYGGLIIGISSIFSSLPCGKCGGINSLFTADDIEGFVSYNADQCAICKEGVPLDAFIYSEGYTLL